MLNKNYTRDLLGLEDVIVEQVENNAGTMHIYLHMAKRVHSCPACNIQTSKVHDYRIQQVKDIESFGRTTILHLRKRRHVCPTCGKRFYEEVPFLPHYHRMTNRMFAHIVSALKEVRSMKSVAKEHHISSTTVSRIFDQVHYPRPKLPKVLSIDEFKGNAGKKKFQCILTDPDKHEVLDILPNRNLEELCGYFAGFDHRKEVRCIIMDMSSLFKSMAKSCFPKARIVADRFHVKRQVSWALENVRKRVQKELSKEMRKYFKKSRWLLLKDPKKLTEEDVTKLEILLDVSEDLRHAYLIKNQFGDFMNCQSRHAARKELSKWIVFTQSYQLGEFDRCCETFYNWRSEILNYFSHNYTNGFTEGMNNKIKVLKRVSYGVRNFERFRNRILYMNR